MRQADQQPFAFNLSQSAQHKLPEASYMFDLRENWFDDRFAAVEMLPAVRTHQFLPHHRTHAAVRGIAGGAGSLGGTYKSMSRKTSAPITALLK